MSNFKNVPMSEEFDSDNRRFLAVFILNKDGLRRYIESNIFDDQKFDPIIKLLCSRSLGCAEAIARLHMVGHLEEAVMLSRSLLESAINIGFINCNKVGAADMMYEYTIQSIIREMDAIYELGNTKLEVKSGIKYELSDEIKSSIEKYTTKKGKPVRDWTNKKFGVEKRLKIVTDNYGGKYSQILPITFLSNYSIASELLHGSLHGIKKFLIDGIVMPEINQMKDKALDNRKALLFHHLQSVNIMILAIFEFTARNIHENIEEYKVASDLINDAHKKKFKDLANKDEI